MRSPLTFVVLLSLLLLGPTRPVRAQEVTAVQRSLVALRVLAYDRNLKARAGEALTIAIVHRPDRKESVQAASEANAALTGIAQKSRVAGLPLKVVSIASADAAVVDERIQAVHAAALLVCPDMAEAVAPISAMARKRGVLTLTWVEAFVRAGLSVGVLDRGGKPSLVINLPAARGEGADLDAAVLRLAEVIR